MDNTLSISVRNLGIVNLSSYCPRCFKFLLHLRFHPPFRKGGGAIFRWMEDIERSVVLHHLEKSGSLPKEFAPFCDCKKPIEFPKHWSKFRYMHDKGAMIHGIPDQIFELEDGTLCVIDYKTARRKGEDDEFLPIYKAQVIGYANIAEKGLKLGTVSKGGLLYWEAQHEAVRENPEQFYSYGEITVPFIPQPFEITIDYKLLDQLLDEALDVWNSSSEPEARIGCDDCKAIAALLAIQDTFELRDQNLLRRFPDYPLVVRDVMTRQLQRKSFKREALIDIATRDFSMSSNGVFANWEFDDAADGVAEDVPIA
jgi:hypothetical protein